RARLAIEAGLGLRVTDAPRGQDLDGDVTIESRVLRAIDLTHPARADGGDDLVGTKASPGGECHRRGESIRRSSGGRRTIWSLVHRRIELPREVLELDERHVRHHPDGHAVAAPGDHPIAARVRS